jgi:uncharacterized protein (DUF1800 family)
MRPRSSISRAAGLALAAALGWSLFAGGTAGSAVPASVPTVRAAAVHLPWKEAGLTEREAAAHLLSRFTFGARPGEVDRVVALGLDRWFERQLAADLPDRRLEQRLEELPALDLPAAEIARLYPPPGRLLLEARRAGVIPGSMAPGKEAADLTDPADPAGPDKKETRAAVLRWARRQGYRSQKELTAQLQAQKLWRAVESENQLGEVMTDFWLNHFSVSTTDNQSRPHLLSYERDAIRPHALGRVRELLEATARHPAMLLYLDNAQSTAAMDAPTTLDEKMGPLLRRRAEAARARRAETAETSRKPRSRGLNENYARELLELHTLGVDGGYTQQDVTEVARAFTGWTVLPAGRLGEAGRRGRLGFEVDGQFLFRADAHDAGKKVILGRSFPAGRGIEDGEAVLDLVAAHPATARHLAAKLAVRFVSDQPSPALIDRLAEVYRTSGGDTRAMLAALASSPEFWKRETVGAKIKSPFEVVASALRSTGARVEDPREALEWIAKMGQPLYAAPAPTGYPDRAEAWVNTGALLQRMNFGLELAAGRVRGVEVDADRAVAMKLGSPEFQRR